MTNRLFFYYNHKKKAIAVIDRESHRNMRGNSLATHGLGAGAVYRIFDRELTEIEKPYYKSLTRAKVFFYDSIELLIREEQKAGVPVNMIDQLKQSCKSLELKNHQPEIEFLTD